MPNLPVSVIGKYQIAELVGEGAMGTVYRALDPVINRSVAIKVMSDAIARDGTLRDRFLREAQAAGSLQHPNVVTIYDFGEFDGHLYIAMEFVDGMDLDQLLEQRVPLTLDQRLGIIIDVLVGLSYAHKHGVVHRDIKPANIRVTQDGRAKIMDFGVAHLDSAQMTATGMMVGTPNYMAPEQITGQRIVPATDLFSVGAVLYELLSQRKAFGADSLHNVLFKVVSEDPPPLAIVAPDVPTRLEPIVRRALAKDAHERYQTAQEMANDLSAVRAMLSGAPASALSLGATIASHTAEHRARQAARAAAVGGPRRWRRVVGSTVAAAVAIVGGMWAYTSYGAAAADPADGAGSRIVAGDAVPQASGAPSSALDSLASPRTPSGPAPAPRADTAPPPERPAPPPSARASQRPAAAPDRARETEIVAAVRASALSARTRAAAAGATREQLAAGDASVADADRLTNSGAYAAAVAALNTATLAWANAEREAAPREATPPAPRAAAPPSRVPSESTAGSAPRSLPTAPPLVTSSPVTAPAAPPVPRGEVPVAPATAIAALVAEYARAIEARDLTAIRAVYPSITAEQQRGFERFFASVRTLRATLRAATPVVEGTTATARISGEYDFTDAAGKAQRQPVTFSATFRHDGSAWRIREVR